MVWVASALKSFGAAVEGSGNSLVAMPTLRPWPVNVPRAVAIKPWGPWVYPEVSAR